MFFLLAACWFWPPPACSCCTAACTSRVSSCSVAALHALRCTRQRWSACLHAVVHTMRRWARPAMVRGCLASTSAHKLRFRLTSHLSDCSCRRPRLLRLHRQPRPAHPDGRGESSGRDGDMLLLRQCLQLPAARHALMLAQQRLTVPGCWQARLLTNCRSPTAPPLLYLTN